MKIIKEQKKNRETTYEIKNELKYKKKDTFYFCGHSTSSSSLVFSNQNCSRKNEKMNNIPLR